METEKKHNSNYGGARKGAGRPKGTSGIKKKNTKGTTRVVFQVSCQPEQLKAITDRATELGLSKSSYIINLVEKDLKM